MRAWLSCLVAVGLLSVSIGAQQTATISHPSFLRSSPTNADPPLGRLKTGDTITLLAGAKQQGYYHVQTSDGKEGWVWARNVAATTTAPPSAAAPSAAPPSAAPPPPPPPPAAGGGGATVAPGGVAAAAPRGGRARSGGSRNSGGTRSGGGTTGAHGGATGGAPGGTPAPGDEAIDTPSCQPTGTNKSTNQTLSDTDKDGLLNLAKRHIPSGTPKTLQLTDFVTLENAAETAFGINAHTQDFVIEPSRDKLKSLPGTAASEGDFVQLAAYINFAHTEQPESVNCYDAGHLDIHINLGPKNGSQMQGIVVEMIPQLPRPAGWDEGTLLNLSALKMQVLAVGGLTLDSQHRLRNTADKKDTQPQRVALWEIHPVIEFYVCETASCDPAHHEQWTPLRDWKAKHP
ncbi:MAG TPA: SH3 domain-containing protein [Vicinamibacterales bacterium]